MILNRRRTQMTPRLFHVFRKIGKVILCVIHRKEFPRISFNFLSRVLPAMTSFNQVNVTVSSSISFSLYYNIYFNLFFYPFIIYTFYNYCIIHSYKKWQIYIIIVKNNFHVITRVYTTVDKCKFVGTEFHVALLAPRVPRI